MSPTKIKFFQLCLIFFVLSRGVLFAQAGWNVSPMIFNINVVKGDTTTEFFTVFNKTDEPKSFQISCMDWTIDELGRYPELEPGDHPRGCAGCLEITPQNFTVEPGSSQIVRFTMIVPVNSPPGSHWCSLFVNPSKKPTLASKIEGEGRSFSVFVAVRAKIQINVTVSGDLKEEGEITDLEVEVDSAQTTLSIKSTFLNTGNMRLICRGTVEIRDEMGEPLESFPLEQFESLPGDERFTTTMHIFELEPGEYSAMVVIDFGADFLVAGEAFFEIP